MNSGGRKERARQKAGKSCVCMLLFVCVFSQGGNLKERYSCYFHSCFHQVLSMPYFHFTVFSGKFLFFIFSRFIMQKKTGKTDKYW